MIFPPHLSTMELIELVFSRIKEPPKRALDLCCGDGWIGRKIVEKFPSVDMVYADIDTSIMGVVHGDLFESISGSFSLVVCNPPYLPSFEITKDLKPVLAYHGGTDGFRIIEKIVLDLPRYLTEGGTAFLEIHHTHGKLFPPTWEIVKNKEGVDSFAIWRNE